MIYTIPISTKGQIVIPKSIRTLLGLKRGHHVTLSVKKKNHVVLSLTKTKPLTDFIGTLTSKKHNSRSYLDNVFIEKRNKS